MPDDRKRKTRRDRERRRRTRRASSRDSGSAWGSLPLRRSLSRGWLRRTMRRSPVAGCAETVLALYDEWTKRQRDQAKLEEESLTKALFESASRRSELAAAIRAAERRADELERRSEELERQAIELDAQSLAHGGLAAADAAAPEEEPRGAPDASADDAYARPSKLRRSRSCG